jgi:hypothetical protein
MKIWDNAKPAPEPYRFIAILWLTFLITIPATGIFFSIFHPRELLTCTALPLISNLAAYTIGFFSIWFLTAISGLLVTYFLSTGSGQS